MQNGQLAQNQLALGLLLPLLLLAGCSAESGSPSPGAQPGIGATGTVRVSLDFTAARESGMQARLPEAAQTYTISVLDALTGLETVPSVEAGQTPETVLPVDISDVPVGRVSVVVNGRTPEGVLVGTFEEVVEVTAGATSQVDVVSLFVPGPTREIGLLGISSNGVQADGPSSQPSISADGRYVAFASEASNLLPNPGIDPSPRGRIYVRDRSLGTTRRMDRDGIDVFLGGRFGHLCSEPSISDDRLVAFVWDENVYLSDGRTSTRLSTGLALGQQILNGRHPRISGDATSVVFESQHTDAQLGTRTLVLRRAATGVVSISDNVEIVSVNSEGSPTTGAAVSPSVSRDGRFVAFVSNALDPSFPGPHVYLRDRTLRTTTALFPRSALRPVAISADGLFIAAQDSDGRLDLYDRKTGQLETVAQQTFGPPSLSGDGRFLAFYSAQTNLVFNDRNLVSDAFVWDRLTRTFARINVAADGAAVEGTVAMDGSGPAISASGNRVALASTDDLLVPGTESSGFQLEVFSTTVPSTGILYVSIGTSILRYGNVVLTSGSPVGKAEIRLPGQALGRIVLDTANDRLYVADSTPGNARIFVINQISTRGGDLTPDRTISLTLGAPTDLALDLTRDLLYTTNMGLRQVSVFDSPSKLNGSVAPNRVIQSAFATSQSGLFLDSREDAVYVGSVGVGGSRVEVFKPASTLKGSNLSPSRQLGGASTLLGIVAGLEMDPSARGGPEGHHSNLVVASRGPGRLNFYLGNGSDSSLPFGNVAPLRSITGSSSGLNAESIPGQTVVDRFSGSAYVSLPLSGSVLVFNEYTATGNTPPSRDLPVGPVVRGIALDRTR